MATAKFFIVDQAELQKQAQSNGLQDFAFITLARKGAQHFGALVEGTEEALRKALPSAKSSSAKPEGFKADGEKLLADWESNQQKARAARA